MKKVKTAVNGFQKILERNEADLVRILRSRNGGIVIEKSPEQMDEIQGASERDMAIQNVDRESTLLRDVRSALQRIDEGAFGPCIECETEISPKRLAAMPWASRCIHCQDVVERDGRENGTL